MTQIPLGQFAYRRDNLLLPHINLRNMYFETAPTEKGGAALLSRPFLNLLATLPTQPVRVIRWEKDVFNDDALVAAGNTLYRVTQAGTYTTIGTIAGNGYVDIAFSDTSALVASGGVLQQTDGVTLTNVAFPDTQNVISVGFIDGYFLAVPANSHRIYYTDLPTGLFTDIRFVSAERYPDNLRRIVITSDEVWAMGSASVEIFQPTGLDDSDNPPFQRIEGRLYKKGLINTASLVEADNAVQWIGPAEQGGLGVYRSGGDVPTEISNESIAERLSRANVNDLVIWTFGWRKHVFVVVSMGAEGTWAYDVLTARWYEWTTYQRAFWRASQGQACWPGTVLAGDSETGALYVLSDDAVTDNGILVQQVWTGVLGIGQQVTSTGGVTASRVANFNTIVDCSVGVGPQSLEPEVVLRTSDDQGRTWEDQGPASLGKIGEYDVLPQWNRCGLMQPPSRIFEFSMSDPVRLRVTGARANETD